MHKTMIQAGWNFENSYSSLPEMFFTRQNPIPVNAPQAVIVNEDLALLLGLQTDYLKSKEGEAVLAGNSVPPGAQPLAQAYAGHQFGRFTMLGDGRALLIGEQITPALERFDLHLKGAGPTPYSRGGDGRAALGPMLREYLISEAMHHLGIPTTRGLAVVKTGEPVYREETLSGAVLVRCARSHLRVGTFQYAAVRGRQGDLKALADYAINRHYPEIAPLEDKYVKFLQKVLQGQAALISQWMLVGFVHGVMNTDNMTISGETIDYGPCAFMDTYHPTTVFSSIDRQGRYAYSNQPEMALWNLTRFAEALLSLLHEDPDRAVETAQDILNRFPELYQQHWLTGMAGKLGLKVIEEEDKELIKNLLGLMQRHKADYTNTFLDLTFGRTSQSPLAEAQEFLQWKEHWEQRLKQQQGTTSMAQALMRQNNPAVIPRNHKVEEALRAAVQKEDYSLFHQMLTVLKDPFAHSPEQREYAEPPPPSAQPYRTFCGT